jgi:hypothetical protein
MNGSSLIVSQHRSASHKICWNSCGMGLNEGDFSRESATVRRSELPLLRCCSASLDTVKLRNCAAPLQFGVARRSWATPTIGVAFVG